MQLRPLNPVQARVLATLMEKARTVPDSYPLTLDSLVAGRNRKTSRSPGKEVAALRSAVQNLYQQLGMSQPGHQE